MDAAFDLQTEVANLARRIVGPVAAKVAQRELDTAVGQIRHAFQQLNSKSAEANVDFENMAVHILEPMRATLSEANFARIVGRLRGGYGRVLST
jgi:ubiquinone biosynthesis protein UbiJ